MLRIWGRRSSFNVQKVMWLVGELGLAHEHIDAGGSFGGLDTPGFLAMNPHGRVPVIADGDAVVWESHASFAISPRADGARRFWSDDPAARARVEGWMDWSQTSLQPDFLTGVFWGFLSHARGAAELAGDQCRRSRDARSTLASWTACSKAGPSCWDEELSLADITAGTSLYRYFELEIERPSLPNVERWYRALAERDAYRTHVMIPFGELFGRLDF